MARKKTRPPLFKPDANQLTDTLRGLEDALTGWEKIPNDAESEYEQFRNKTRDLVKKLNEQIKELDLD